MKCIHILLLLETLIQVTKLHVLGPDYQITCFGTRAMTSKIQECLFWQEKSACGTQQVTKGLKILVFVKMFIICPRLKESFWIWPQTRVNKFIFGWTPPNI